WTTRSSIDDAKASPGSADASLKLSVVAPRLVNPPAANLLRPRSDSTTTYLSELGIRNIEGLTRSAARLALGRGLATSGGDRERGCRQPARALAGPRHAGRAPGLTARTRACRRWSELPGPAGPAWPSSAPRLP